MLHIKDIFPKENSTQVLFFTLGACHSKSSVAASKSLSEFCQHINKFSQLNFQDTNGKEIIISEMKKIASILSKVVQRKYGINDQDNASEQTQEIVTLEFSSKMPKS